MIGRACLTALMLAGTAAVAQQQPVVVVADAGPGPVGRYLAEVLLQPDTRIIVGDTVSIGRDDTYPASVVVIGRRADVRGQIQGDLVVVGGDLFIKPGARVLGQGIAIGGGAYGSLLGVVAEGLTSYRDFTFDAAAAGDRIELRYREQYVGGRGIVEWPIMYGLRFPAYDRSNGASIPIGPSINLGRASFDALATYRSQIGRVDPSITATIPVGRKLTLEGFIGRETRTSDGWINGAFSNSLNALANGRDERNWYRATGGWGSVGRMFETPAMTARYSLKGSFERARSARPGPAPTSGPWSWSDRTDTLEGMFRPNPQVLDGDITSITGRAAYRWTAGTIKARLDVDVEVPVAMSIGESFIQSTVDGRIEFPTFGRQRYRLELHGVGTALDAAPIQRFAYIGGSGTLPTEDVLLGMGGDELLFIESRYEIPLPILLPIAGSPTVTFRHILGSAGVQELPPLTQIVGLRLAVPFVRVEFLLDTDSGKTKFNAGLSLNR